MIQILQNFSRSIYYKRIFFRNRKKIKRMMCILDNKSKSIIKNIFSGYTAVINEQTLYFSKACDNPCTEYHFTTKQGYDVFGTENPYFIPDFFDLNQITSYLDGGAYIGDTIELLNCILKRNCQYIYAFEPNPDTYKLLCDNVKKYGNTVKCYQCGLDNHNGYRFFTCKDSASKIDCNGNTKIQVIDTAEFLEGISNKPQFIKLDIEGNEKIVIESIASYLKKYKPDLAISIYHSLEDLWDIPLMLKRIVPEYNIFIRHQSNYFTETICYATITNK